MKIYTIFKCESFVKIQRQFLVSSFHTVVGNGKRGQLQERLLLFNLKERFQLLKATYRDAKGTKILRPRCCRWLIFNLCLHDSDKR